MAAKVVGGAFLSASLQMLFDRMASQEVVYFVRECKLDERLLKKLETLLLSADKFLNDAEMKQLTDRKVRKWLEELKDAIYNAEDLVYEIYTKALRSEMNIKSENRIKRIKSKVLNFLSSGVNFNDLESRIVEILDTLVYLMEQKEHLGLRQDFQTRSFPRSFAATLVEESDFYGRDADKEAIVELLLSDEVGDDKICVIPIVGMGGIGKTTLAEHVYRGIDDRAMDKPFDIKAWITVSEEHDVLTKSIYDSLTGSSNIYAEENFEVQLKLKKLLYGKKFLFVLDDVWNLTSRGWFDLKTTFESALLGSKIIVTTRNKDIGSIMGTVPNRWLRRMSDEDGWKLFTKHAFKNLKPRADADFEAIGREIFKKCGGLPLAVKSLGSLLCTLQNPKEWENVLKNDIWKLPQKECNVIPALFLSYYYLPPHLKRCFGYCSIYPKGREFEKENLILLWMAEDLLQPQTKKILEEVGEEYFKDLTSRSFFHSSWNGRFTTMHDLVNDLAKFVSGESCFRFDDCDSETLMKTRHLSCFRHNNKDIKKLKDLSKNKVLRTLLVSDNLGDEAKDYIINRVRLQSMQYLRVLCERPLITKLLDSIGTLKLLRYLDLSHSLTIKEVPDTICTLYNLQTLLLRYCEGLVRLPNSIGNLKHLRYLDLQMTQVQKLPDSICNLHNLHTLNLDFCERLTCLPANFELLANLRNLNLTGTSLEEMPPQMSKLKYLQVLTDFVVGNSSASNIKELGKLQYLSGLLNISCLENVVNVEDVSEANLKDKKNISELRLEWNGDTEDSSKAREILDRLEPAHTNLRRLDIVNYRGTSFSGWVGHHSFSCIKEMRLSRCKNCHWLPPLGQLPCLEKLDIWGFDMVERIGHEFYYSNGSSSSSSSTVTTKPFKSLKFLSFGDMPQWKEWLSSIDGVFLNLKELELWNCPKLNGFFLPDYLPSLTNLDIKSSEQLFASLSLSDCQYPSLEELWISDCPNMESFPSKPVRLPCNVKTIIISGCKQLVSFSEEGWPSNLKSLQIIRCEKLFGEHSMTKWNLQMLTSLTHLLIDGIDKVIDTFPEEEGQLPTTLTSLKLFWLRNLKSLNGEAIQRLPSLKQLLLWGCYRLPSLPEELPASLLELNISYCPLLKPQCQKGIGQDWPKIAHIPFVTIDHEDYWVANLEDDTENTQKEVFQDVQDANLEDETENTQEEVFQDVQDANLEDETENTQEEVFQDVQDANLEDETENTQEEVFQDVQDANLKDGQSIAWRGDTDDIKNIQAEVFDRLQLQKLNLSFGHISNFRLNDMHMELKSFPNWGGYGSFSCLVKVDLVCCKSCYCLPPLGQLPSLKKLHIQGFDRVERIGDEFYSTDTLSLSKPFKSLESLTFSHMLWWKEWSFMKSGVFSDLKQLTLDNCRKLKGMCFPNYLPSLKSLLISGCKQEVVASLSTDGLPLLSFLKIGQCKELKSFPIRALPANVDTVNIMGCKELVSLSEDGWPSKLKSLEISYCGKLFGNSLWWNLRTLTSLTSLQIIKIDEVVDSFPEEWQLPTTLKSLTLSHFRNLKSLNGKALQHHTSLKELKIEFCHHLHYLPEEGLPDSLSQLEIFGCGFLNRRCQKERGEDWPKISHIPHIRIDCKEI